MTINASAHVPPMELSSLMPTPLRENVSSIGNNDRRVIKVAINSASPSPRRRRSRSVHKREAFLRELRARRATLLADIDESNRTTSPMNTPSAIGVLPLAANPSERNQPSATIRSASPDHLARSKNATASPPSPTTRRSARRGPSCTFHLALHLMLECAESGFENNGRSYSHIASWQPHGRAFRIHNKQLFVKEVMPHYFKQSKFGSFQRQLSNYGFRRISTPTNADHGAYYHELFLRGKPNLCHGMDRIRNTAAARDDSSSGSMVDDMALVLPPKEPNFYAMEPVGAATTKPVARSRSAGSNDANPAEPLALLSSLQQQRSPAPLNQAPSFPMTQEAKLQFPTTTQPPSMGQEQPQPASSHSKKHFTLDTTSPHSCCTYFNLPSAAESLQFPNDDDDDFAKGSQSLDVRDRDLEPVPLRHHDSFAHNTIVEELDITDMDFSELADLAQYLSDSRLIDDNSSSRQGIAAPGGGRRNCWSAPSLMEYI